MTFLSVRLPPELAGLVTEDANKEDLGTIVFLLKLLTNHYRDRLPKQVYDRLIARYGETRTQKRAKSIARRKRALIRLGFADDEAEDLAHMSSEELKQLVEVSRASAYKEQTKLGKENRRDTEVDELLEELGSKREELKLLKHMREDRVKEQYGKQSLEVEKDLIIEIEILQKKLEEKNANGVFSIKTI